jgi:hypothetical protein
VTMTQYNFCYFAYECWAGAWVELCGSMKFLDAHSAPFSALLKPF